MTFLAGALLKSTSAVFASRFVVLRGDVKGACGRDAICGAASSCGEALAIRSPRVALLACRDFGSSAANPRAIISAGVAELSFEGGRKIPISGAGTSPFLARTDIEEKLLRAKLSSGRAAC